MNAADFVSRLGAAGKPKQTSTGWQARCPAHEDSTASLTITQGDDKVLLYCHALCTTEAVVAAARLKMTDLFTPKTATNGHARKSEIVATYDYTDESGVLLCQAVRYEPKGFKQRRPDASKPGGWNWSMKDVRLVPYRLPELIAAVAAGRNIFICEGEKDCNALHAHKLTATCNVGGAGKWKPEFAEFFGGASVCVIADKDRAGRDHAQQVAANLQSVASHVVVIELPDIGEAKVKDVSDYLSAGGTFHDIVAIVDEAPPWTPQAPTTDNETTTEPPTLASRISSRLFSPLAVLVRPEPVFYIGGVGVCTAGNLTTITAAAKAGKTAFEVAMQAAAFSPSHDGDYLGVTSSNPNGLAMIHFDTEQSIYDHHELVRRTATRSGLATPPPWFRSYCLTGFSVPDLQAALRIALDDARRDFGGIHSVFIDGAADMVIDVNDAKESNAFVAALQAQAIEFECPIIEIVHLNPGSPNKSRGHLGSQLERKSETNLRLEKADDTTCVWADKNRRAPITKENGPRFRWDDAAGMHVSCAPVADARLEDKIEKLSFELDEVFSEKSAMRYSDLKSTVKKALTVTDSTAERRITKYRHHSLITKSVANMFTRAA